ncbi:iron complex outermembrane receptor protein [Silvibacterium bohemicum]|uniref:Iron complex outermembrane receptor protein n=1 Tax=Silvibacterium bohemicum TaxID=1577686 RepID=A0A841JXX8_9BACT|nr:TonB-dependent receptor [Silvibacterium bohemicum]MBB6145277.1 iron complex outermembrane receptor protein [Silvibacterium bohemicum]
MFRSLLSLIFAAALFVSVPNSGYAQSACPSHGDPEVTLSGIISDPSGALLRDAQVTLTCGNLAVSATTDATGAYTVQLPAGTYSLAVVSKGFTTKQQTFQVLPNRANQQDLVLNVAQENSTVEVRAGAQGYAVSENSEATRTDTSIRDIPQAVYVIPEQVLQDQQVIRLADAVRNVSGVTIAEDAGGRQERVTLRGFVTDTTFQDGFRNASNANATFPDFANVERVDILKGPSSTVFGRLDPGGVVNLVTKQPLSEHYYSATMQGGSYQLLRPTIDASGPLTANKSLLYRFIASGQDSQSFRDFNFTRRLFLSPTLTWTPSPSTSLRLYTEFLGGSNLNDRGLIAIGTRPANLPVSRYLADPNLVYPYRQGKAGLSFDQALGRGWTFRSYERSSTGWDNYNARVANALSKDMQMVTLNDLRSDQYFQAHYWINEVTGTVKTGPIQHTLLAGAELDYEIYDTNTTRQASGTPAETLNIYYPNYAALPPRDLMESTINQTRDGYGGGYLQDQITLTPKLKVTGGLRYDLAKLKTVGYFASPSSSSRDTAWSPRVGLVYDPVQAFSFYATYNKSFQPESGTQANGTPFVPEYGRLLETGFKFDTLSHRVTGTAAVYQIDLTNVITADPNNPGFSIQLGQQRSRGMEFNALTHLTHQWDLISGYALTNATIHKDNTYLVDSQLQSVPRHTGNLWTRYTQSQGRLSGASIGAGVSGVSNMQGQLITQAAPNTFYLVPGWGRVDAGISYEPPKEAGWRYRFALNANNLLDRRYFSGASGRFAVYPGSPRDIIASFQLIR